MTRRVLLIHNGRILAEGDVREIRDLHGRAPAHRGPARARPAARWREAVVGWPHVLSLTLRRRRGSG